MKPGKINIHEAKTHLSRLVEDVANGNEVLIAKGGRAMARLVPLGRDDSPRRLGLLKGKLRIADDFDRAGCANVGSSVELDLSVEHGQLGSGRRVSGLVPVDSGAPEPRHMRSGHEVGEVGSGHH